MVSKRLIIEKFYPFAAATASAVGGFFFNFDLNNYPMLLSNAVNISAILLGFMGTLAGIVLSSNSKAIKFMKKIDKLSSLFGYIWGSIQSSFIFLLASICLQLFPSLIKNHIWISEAWLFLGVCSIFLTHRGVSVSIALLHSAAHEPEV